MSRSKDFWMEETGGFRFFETPAEFTARYRRIQSLRARIHTLTDAERSELYELLNLPPDEWDYVPADERED